MVQLHMSRRHVETSLRRGGEELEEPYRSILVEYYYDLVSDPRVNSITTLKLHLDKLRAILRWMQEQNVRPGSIDERVVKRLLLYLRAWRGLNHPACSSMLR